MSINFVGHTGHQPFAWPRFGQGNQPLTTSALCDFTNNYQHRLSTEWAPITNAGVGCSKASGPVYAIYHKNVGLIPNYTGHVPGAMFRLVEKKICIKYNLI